MWRQNTRLLHSAVSVALSRESIQQTLLNYTPTRSMPHQEGDNQGCQPHMGL